jgi:hypothetical protein
MTYNPWPKGSQWRKWDLHVHTPASLNWKGGKQLSDMNSKEKDVAFNDQLNAIESSEVSVFCFTDYWTFDGYIQFKNYLERNKLECSKKIFPGIELRVEAPADYRPNLQIILSDSLTNQQLDDFKSALKVALVERPSRSISDEAIIEFAKELDASKAKEYGFDDPKLLDKEKLLELGASTVVITNKSLKEAVSLIYPKSAFIVQPWDTYGGLDNINWKAQPHAINYFMQRADIIESRKEETINLFLGEKTDKNEKFFENFQTSIKFKQKPVICGSDAHRFADYGNFPSNKNLWIKADPTFQGFKQIIYEPRDRVKIQEFQPQDKTQYRVIDKIRFIDNTGEKHFSNNWIELNENLNTIVGGKSSGKSLLMYHIAKTISPNLVEKRKTEVDITDYAFGNLGEFDFEVVWKDEVTDKLSFSPESREREIEYIPQMYVNKLAEEDGKNSLYELIESILNQNTDYREFNQKITPEIKLLEIGIEQAINELLRLRENHTKDLSDRRKIGEKPGIAKEIERLNGKISELRDASNFTESEERKYLSLLKRQKIQRDRKQKYRNLTDAIQTFIRTIEQLEKHTKEVFYKSKTDIGLDKFTKRILPVIITNTEKATIKTINGIIVLQKSIAKKTKLKSTKCAQIEQNLLREARPFSEKIRDKNALIALEENLKKEQETLNKYEEKDAQLKNTKEAGKRTRDDLFDKYTKLFDLHMDIIRKLQIDAFSNIGDGIKLETHFSFDLERFSELFIETFNRKRTNFISIFGNCFDGNKNFLFDENTHIETIKDIYTKLSQTNKDFYYKAGLSNSDALKQLFKNYFLVEYNIKYKNDNILEMSPGKRGLVLLQLILHISNATHPILIDQPEDNLDNRTISNELKQFIKDKKLVRQIIMVTHDANLVVLTDAENVIVSNQSGQQADRDNRAFQFEYITGGIEYSFRDNDPQNGILYSCGIREHVCDVLEGGEPAFIKREEKYDIPKK